MVKMRLGAAGYEIILACDGQEGFDKAKKNKPDLIILDLMLPKMDGYKVCGLLKNDARYSKIPIIIFTARVQKEEDVRLGKDIGAEEYVTKPFDSKIIDLVPEALARKHELIPVLKIGNRLTCAMADPWNVFALDEVRSKTHLIIETAVATEGEIKKALNEYYGAKGSMEDMIKSIDAGKLGFGDDKEIDLKKLQVIVIKLVNMIIMKAIQERASDIHVEPEENALKTRFRVDGMLHPSTERMSY